MKVTLTHLDGSKGAHEILPTTDPHSGITIFSARPSDGSGRHFGMTQDILAGFGVQPHLAGGGRNVTDDLAQVRARMRAYDTQLLIVRHADLLHPRGNVTALDLLLDLCDSENVSLALTCDDTVGERLGDWVESKKGRISTDAQELLHRVPVAVAKAAEDQPADFPRHVPKADFYAFRAEARAVLPAHQFKTLDGRYTGYARKVLDNPFQSDAEASDALLAECQSTDNPAEVATILRAAQAAMFRHGMLLKVDVPHFTRLVIDGTHRKLSDGELNALRAYRASWMAATVVLVDAGFSYEQVAEITMAQVRPDGTLTAGPELVGSALTILSIHRHYRILTGASSEDPLVIHDPRRLSAVAKEAASDLGLPCDPPRRGRSHTGKDRWRKALGVVLMPLEGMAQFPRQRQPRDQEAA